MNCAATALTDAPYQTGNDEHQTDTTEYPGSAPQCGRVIDDGAAGRLLGQVIHPHRLILLVAEDKAALGVGDLFTTAGGEGNFRMRTASIQVADDAIGGLCVSEEFASIKREIDGNAQQDDTNQGKEQTLQYLPEA